VRSSISVVQGGRVVVPWTISVAVTYININIGWNERGSKGVHTVLVYVATTSCVTVVVTTAVVVGALLQILSSASYIRQGLSHPGLDGKCMPTGRHQAQRRDMSSYVLLAHHKSSSNDDVKH
jgi:hypothetical protein